MSPRYGPPDASAAPRYTGVRTFARCPHVTSLDEVDVAVVGVPFDTATSRRPGARFGPEAIRGASIGLRPYHPPLDVDVFARLSVVDRGDIAVTPGNAERTAGQIAAALEPVVRAGVIPLIAGRRPLDRARRAARPGGRARPGGARAARRPRGHVGPVLRGAVLPRHAVPARAGGGPAAAGALPARGDAGPALLGLRPRPTRAGWDSRSWRTPSCTRWTRPSTRAGCGSASATQPAFFSFDIDVIDPAFAPGTGTPEVAGLEPREALALVRALAGMRFTGFDVVEVSPPYDGPGETTALVAASVAYEFLALTAIAAPRVSFPLHKQVRLFWQKRREYERNERRRRKLRMQWHFLRRDSYLRFPVNGNLLEALDEGRADIGPWVLIERGLLVLALPRDRHDADRARHDRQPRLHDRGDRPHRRGRALHVRQPLLPDRCRPPLRRPGQADHLAGNDPEGAGEDR